MTDTLKVDLRLVRADGTEHRVSGEIPVLTRTEGEADPIELLFMAASIAGQLGTEIVYLVTHDCTGDHDPSFLRVPGDSRN